MNMINNLLKQSMLFCMGLIFFLVFGTPMNAYSKNDRNHEAELMKQQKIVTGTILDSEGLPLIGATIQIEGTSIGTTTDLDGRYELMVPLGTVKLIYSYIGYESQTIDATGRTSINVTLIESASELDELVVIAYGTAKRRDLIGAIDHITSESLEKRSNPSVTRSLQGQIPNLNITMRDGKPNRETAYNVRGETSIGAGGSALILIDGVEGDPSTINPQDIESISVLKDASSAAVYGARGTFGVVLITTKRAQKGSVKLNYNGNYSMYTRTVKPSLVTNGYDWTTSFMNSYDGYNDYLGTYPVTINNIFPFTLEWYEELKRRNDNPELPKIRVNNNGLYEYFGNTDWHALLYKDWSHGTEHNLSLTGGSDIASYYLSGRFFSQDGIYRFGSDDLKRYNLRGKGRIDVNEKLVIDNNFSVDNSDYHYPLISYTDELVQRNMEHQGFPVAMMFNPDGTYTHSSLYNGVGDFHQENSFQDDNTLNLRNTLAFTYTPLKNRLIFKGDFTYSYKDWQRTRVNRYHDYSEGPGLTGTRGQSLRRMWNQETNYYATNLTANFMPNLGENHSLSVLVGGNYESSIRRNIYNRRDNYLYPEKPNFILMDGENYVLEERSIDWAFLGIFARANYSYLGKYLFEVSSRYDGSSKFPLNEQWGIFPSASVGWILSEESFMQSSDRWLDNLKLRFSAGTLGNGNVSPYSYLELMNIQKTSLLLNGGFKTMTSLPSLIPNNLTWEKATTYNAGIDIDMFKSRFNIGVDIYRRNTTDMYVNGPDLPQVLGANAPKGNYADLKTDGWEFTIGWKDMITVAENPLSYNLKVMVWDNQSWVTKFLGNENNLLSSYYEGQRIGDIWGYTIEGLFKDAEEIANHADQSRLAVSRARILLPGDLKFKDLNNDGEIWHGENTLDDPGDLSIIGNTQQRYHFGVNMGANYRGFGLSAFLQGVGKRDWYPEIESGYFWGHYNRPYGYYPTDQVGNMWIDGENEDPNAYWPRLRTYISNSRSKPMGVKNDRYLQNAAYVRLKSLTVDYSLPKELLSRVNMSAVRFYCTGENLWTWTGLTKHTTNFDPEVIESGDPDQASNTNQEHGYSYPMLKNVTFGVNITF